MASSSRPFQSQTVTRLAATYRSWSEATARTVRQLRVGLVWAIQVALYPVYGLFQTGRLIYRQITVANPLGHLTRWGRQLSPTQTTGLGLSSLDGGLSVFWLGWLQSRDMSGLPVSVLNRLERSSALVEDAGQGCPLTLPAQVTAPLVQGVATNLLTRTLVLVMVGNHVLDVLSAQEQDSLRRAIVYWLASRRYAQRQQMRQLTVGNLPLPVPNRRAWWPIQLFQHLMRWVGAGPVAETTNLFGEAERQQHRLNRLPLSPDQLVMPSRQLMARSSGGNQRTAFVSLARSRGISPSQVSAATFVSLSPSNHLKEIQEGLGFTRNILPQDAFPWIEARAVIVSYVDHPIVKLLRWIDQGLLWLETLAQRMWGWVRSYITL